MTLKRLRTKARKRIYQSLWSTLCVLALLPGDTAVYAQEAQQQGAPQEEAPPKIPNDQLDALVAPIALYPDPLLSQVLVASTYPLEIIQLQQWLVQHKDLKDNALTDAVMKQDWDPSIQAMAALPDALKQLAENIKWTTDLGNAFLAQQSDVMDAVQRMRTKAKDAGTLKSNEQQKVETKVIETKTVVVIEQANPQIVYVPSYNPVVVYGPPVYPYPPIYYPPPSYYAAGVFMAFGVGVAIGAAYHGGWGYRCGWGGYGHNNINININNNYVSHYNKTNINNVNRTQQHQQPAIATAGRWQQHLATQSAAPRRCALFQQGNCNKVWRHRARGFHGHKAGEFAAGASSRQHATAYCHESKRVRRQPGINLELRRETKRYERESWRHRRKQYWQPAGSQ